MKQSQLVDKVEEAKIFIMVDDSKSRICKSPASLHIYHWSLWCRANQWVHWSCKWVSEGNDQWQQLAMNWSWSSTFSKPKWTVFQWHQYCLRLVFLTAMIKIKQNFHYTAIKDVSPNQKGDILCYCNIRSLFETFMIFCILGHCIWVIFFTNFALSSCII